jgi:hypothetical protein
LLEGLKKQPACTLSALQQVQPVLPMATMQRGGVHILQNVLRGLNFGDLPCVVRVE